MNFSTKPFPLFVLGLLFLGANLCAQNPQLPVTLQVKNEEAVNSKGLDFSPTFYEDGIVYISTNNAGLKKMTDDKLKLPTMSILRSRRNSEGLLGTPEPFAKELSSKFHEGPVCFDRTTENVFFSRNIIQNGHAKHAKDGEQKMKLFTAKKSGESWSEPAPLPFNTDEYDDCHPSISIDGDKLFFSSNRPGGLGGMDLYVSFRVGESWSEPINAGPSINTTGNEVFPFLHADNTLYFASDGHGGSLGGFDIYFTSPEGSDWTKPVNVGSPFNTKGDDFSLIVDLDKINGYFASNGNGGQGGDDVFSFHVENGNLDDYFFQNKRVADKDYDLLALVYGTDGKSIEGATVRVINLEQNNVVGRDSLGNLITIQNIDGQEVMKVVPPEQSINGTTDAAGRYSTQVKPGNYAIIVSKEGYQTKQVMHKVSKAGNELVINLSLVENKTRWNAVLFNDQTNTPLAGATLVLTNEATGEKDTITTDANGAVDYYLGKNSKYSVDVYQGGRHVGNTKLDTAGWSEGSGSQQGKMTLNITSTPLAPGMVIELRNIYYNYNDASLRPDAKKDLDLVASMLQQNPDISIGISSHTDSRGTENYNLELSQRRADNVVKYLVFKGIAHERLSAEGAGEALIRNRCKDGVNCSEKEHAKNRRTEIKILGDEKALNSRKPNKNKVNQAPGGIRVTTNSNLDYLVIAGSFLMENRATNQVARLKKFGFGQAAVEQFSSSPYFSVVAARANSMDSAVDLKRQLNSKDISSYIKPVPKG